MYRFMESAVGVVLALTLQLGSFAVFAGTSLGVVREHCLDAQSSARQQQVDIDSGWTYILWPPMPFANLDPAGVCLRNSPLREALSAVGIWELESPTAQVRKHIETQLREQRSR